MDTEREELVSEDMDTEVDCAEKGKLVAELDTCTEVEDVGDHVVMADVRLWLHTPRLPISPKLPPSPRSANDTAVKSFEREFST